MNLELFVLGSGGMMPLPGRALTSVLVRREGELFLFDCGEGTQVSLRRLNLRWKKITAIFISHTHADHVTGLPGILMLSSQVDRDEPLYICGPPRIREFVDAMRRTLDMYINYEIVVREIEGGAEAFTGDGYRISSHPLVHTKPCLAWCLEEDMRPGVFYPEKAESLGVPRGPMWSMLQDGSPVSLADGRTVHPRDVLGERRRGRKFCFATDTVAAPGLADFARGSDLFICEGMFDEELAETAAEKRHLTAAQAARIAREAGVRRLGLIHYSPRYADRELKKLLGEAKEIFPEAFLCRDLQHVNLPHED
ncbi:MAG: ribonuclease Z [Spirochaetes bacterium RBG_13_68_11]|nr:MAG: ribonuclease Z [Spirochaetes bacterium RBG_13_68_11]